jgi:rhamnogalacturonan acetylesterase
MKNTKVLFLLLFAVMVTGAWTMFQSSRPTIYLIGDSTVKNLNNRGWGSHLAQYFDTSRIRIENHAIGGRSSRAFTAEGRWEEVLTKLKPGDFVIMQFGHNDGGPVNKAPARGSLKGLGEETQDVVNEKTGKTETVHTFGWYMRKFINDSRAKGAIPIVCSSIPHNLWKDGKAKRDTAGTVKNAELVAIAEKAFFIPLNAIIVDHYNILGEQKVSSEFFTTQENTHTTEAGAKLNAQCVIEGLKKLKDCELNKYLSPLGESVKE